MTTGNNLIVKALILSGVAAAMSGCTFTKDDYTCGQFPDVGCQPMTSVYEKSEGGVDDYRWDFYNGGKEGDPTRKKVVIDRTHNVLQSVYEGDAVLSKPRTMRLKVNHFVTQGDALVTGAVMFIKTSDSQWLLEGGEPDVIDDFK